jgi:hypothetical protein
MFERFTDRARRVVALSQDEARALDHDYIGTEHLLLGLIREEDGVAARALMSLGVSFEVIESQVVEVVGRGPGQPTGHIPFTPRAKKILELALREAQQLGHAYIGTEHILLGIVREGEGVAAQVLQHQGLTLETVREAVIQVLAGQTSEAVESAGFRPVAGWTSHLPRGAPWWFARRRRAEGPLSPTCPTCGGDLAGTAAARTIRVPAEEGAMRAVELVFCNRCGSTITGQVLPDDGGETDPGAGG